MSSPLEDLPPFPTDDVFEYGDQTVLQMRSQPLAIEQSFAVEDDLGTIMNMPLKTVAAREPAAAAPLTGDDPIARLEAKLDAALRQIAVMQQRLESIDRTIMRALMR